MKFLNFLNIAAPRPSPYQSATTATNLDKNRPVYVTAKDELKQIVSC